MNQEGYASAAGWTVARSKTSSIFSYRGEGFLGGSWSPPVDEHDRAFWSWIGGSNIEPLGYAALMWHLAHALGLELAVRKNVTSTWLLDSVRKMRYFDSRRGPVIRGAGDLVSSLECDEWPSEESFYRFVTVGDWAMLVDLITFDIDDREVASFVLTQPHQHDELQSFVSEQILGFGIPIRLPHEILDSNIRECRSASGDYGLMDAANRTLRLISCPHRL